MTGVAVEGTSGLKILDKDGKELLLICRFAATIKSALLNCLSADIEPSGRRTVRK